MLVDARVIMAVVVALMGVVTLFGLYQYRAHDRVWGLKLVVWTFVVLVLAGVGLKYMSLAVPAWLGVGGALAYYVGWRGLGVQVRGGWRHAVRAVAFAVALGPLLAVPYFALGRVGGCLEAWTEVPTAVALRNLALALPGVYLAGALAFLASVAQEAVAAERWPERRLWWVSVALLALLLPALNWYAAGVPDVHACARTGAVGRLCYVLASRPGSVDARDADGRVPLHVAAESGQVEALRALLAAGSRVEARDAFGATPLLLAVPRGHAEVVATLVNAGASADAANRSGVPPLHLAVTAGQGEVVFVLLRAKATVDARDKEGQTALHRAAAAGEPMLAAMLLARGANPNAMTPAGETPLQAAAWRAHEAAARVLVAGGAAVDLQDADGEESGRREDRQSADDQGGVDQPVPHAWIVTAGRTVLEFDPATRGGAAR